MNYKEKFKILIVEDERFNAKILNNMLNHKYSLFFAQNGPMSLEMAHEIIPDLILLDIIMPGMSGFEVIANLKNSDITRRIPVIFITGRNSIEDEQTGLFLGAADYITKPFHSSIVEARVRNHLQIVEYIRTIEQLSKIDLVTNIANRRSFDDQLKREWLRAIRNQTPLSVLMMDLDNFKKYNDTYGHPQGDRLLKSVAKIFEQVLKRSSDFAARWGGEEFSVLLPNTNLNSALDVAEQIRANVEQTIVFCENMVETKTTVSIGVNSTIPARDSSIDKFIAIADKALYAAKESGKNKVCSF